MESRRHRCPSCRELKSQGDFPKNRASWTGIATYCKPCHARITRANIVKNHGTSRAFHLKRRYGVDAVQVEWMVLQQGGVCAICGVDAPVHVDHDYATGAVRGVLCFNCNRGISKLREDVALMRTAIEYLGMSV